MKEALASRSMDRIMREATPETVNVRNEHWRTPLHLVCHEGRADLAARLIEMGADIHATDAWGWPPIWDAAYSKSSSTVLRLLDAGASLDIYSSKGIHLLANAPSIQLFRLFAEHYGHLNVRGAFGGNLLHDVARSPELAFLALNNGCDIEGKDNRGWTPLHHAASFHDCATVPLLLHHGADPLACSPTGWTPLHVAIHRTNETAVRALLAAGVDPTASPIPHPMTGAPITKRGVNHNFGFDVNVVCIPPRKMVQLTVRSYGEGPRPLYDQNIRDLVLRAAK